MTTHIAKSSTHRATTKTIIEFGIIGNGLLLGCCYVFELLKLVLSVRLFLSVFFMNCFQLLNLVIF